MKKKKGENQSERIISTHLDMVFDYYSNDFLKQIGRRKKKVNAIELIVNDFELSRKFNCYLIRQLSDLLPVMIKNYKERRNKQQP